MEKENNLQTLAQYSTIQIGGTADNIFAPATRDELCSIIKEYTSRNLLFIGGGSNLLLPPVIDGSVVLDVNLPRVLDCVGTQVTVSSNYPIGSLLRQLMPQNIGGLEFLAGIPAHIGGLVKMNAGAWGESIGQFISSVLVINNEGEIEEITAESIEFGYRTSNIPGYILEVTLELKEIGANEIEQRFRKILAHRNESHPLDTPSLGCFFKNLVDDEGNKTSAGKLIDDCGLKGTRIGGATVSNSHANFIINIQNATYEDVTELSYLIQNTVLNQTGVLLEPEVIIIQGREV
ncbi:MAG: UDP-N-acetylmuramate dehydrogenase [Candidatus Cloacimonetes bacterium]|nr:UDP-N-acetylmuramate dehydrogenase [Candidatus Cloacimonadota bacterium]